MKHVQTYKTFPSCIRLKHCTQRLDKRRTNSYSYTWYQPSYCNFPLPSGFSDPRTQKNKHTNSIYGQHTGLIIDCKITHTVTTAVHTIFSSNILYTFAKPGLPIVYTDDT